MAEEKSRKDEILEEILRENNQGKDPQDEDWPTQAQEDMLDWIESQGIYIRQ